MIVLALSGGLAVFAVVKTAKPISGGFSRGCKEGSGLKKKKAFVCAELPLPK